MTNKTLQEYANLSAQIKELEGKRAQVGIGIFSALSDLGTKKHVTNFGTFSLTTRTTYKFTKATESLMYDAKEAERREIDLGKAKVKSTTESLRFQSK